MKTTLIIRFSEFEHYDIVNDCDAITLMATTPQGSYCAEVMGAEGKKLRERREAFKTYVLGCMQSHIPPHEFTLG